MRKGKNKNCTREVNFGVPLEGKNLVSDPWYNLLVTCRLGAEN
jgi:hypothetical protein